MAANGNEVCVCVAPGLGGGESGMGLWELNLDRGAVQLASGCCSDSKNMFF